MAEIDPAQDGQLELKKRARRRLVGAVALALLAVIVLPMVMDQEPRPLTQDIQIRIPGQDAAGPPLNVATAPAAALAKPAAIPAPPAAEPPAPENNTESPKPVAPTPAPAPSAAPAAQVKSTAPPSKPDVKSDGKPEANHEQWVVQLGAYQDQGNVKHLLAKLKGLGYPAYTEQVDTAQGPRTRVRSGPFATRMAAEKAQAQLKKIGAGGPQGGIVAQQ